QLVVGLLGLESPLLAALGEVGHLVLELLEGGLEGLMLALPKVPALAVEPNQRARSAPAVLGCPLWSPSRRLAGKGSVHACLLLPHPWEHPKLAPAQQKKQNLARSNWQSRSTFHGATLGLGLRGCVAGCTTNSSADRSEMGQIDRSRRRRGCAGARDTKSAPPRLTTGLS